MPMLLIGCDGGTNATSGVVPEITRKLYDLTTTGQLDEARDLQYRLLRLFDAMIYSPDKDLRVLQLMIRDLIFDLQVAVLQDWWEQMRLAGIDIEPFPPEAVQAATIVITIGPIIFIYPFIQKYFAKGVMLGSLKG